MREYAELLEAFVEGSERILGGNLAGVYLHGSAAMGCFNPARSDIDLLVAVNDPLPDAVKRRYMELVVGLNEAAPAKGIEMSVVRRAACRPFAYPTPFELHFSPAHLDWYRRDPDDYVRRMNGTDRDLAAHAVITRRRGRVLCGEPIGEVFGPVRAEDYFDSILSDVASAREDIRDDPVYVILNLARALAYCREGAVLSKQEGGEWGLARLPGRYRPLVEAALAEYATSAASAYDAALAGDYAEYALGQLREGSHHRREDL